MDQTPLQKIAESCIAREDQRFTICLHFRQINDQTYEVDPFFSNSAKESALHLQRLLHAKYGNGGPYYSTVSVPTGDVTLIRGILGEFDFKRYDQKDDTANYRRSLSWTEFGNLLRRLANGLS